MPDDIHIEWPMVLVWDLNSVKKSGKYALAFKKYYYHILIPSIKEKAFYIMCMKVEAIIIKAMTINLGRVDKEYIWLQTCHLFLPTHGGLIISLTLFPSYILYHAYFFMHCVELEVFQNSRSRQNLNYSNKIIRK